MPKKVSSNNQEQLALTALDYLHAKEVEKDAKKMTETLRKPLEECLDSEGIEAPNGSRFVELSFNGTTIVLEHRKKSAQSTKEGAEEKLKSLGLEDCIEYKPTINIDMVMSAYDNGKLTEEDLKEMFEEKSSYALYVKKK